MVIFCYNGENEKHLGATNNLAPVTVGLYFETDDQLNELIMLLREETPIEKIDPINTPGRKSWDRAFHR